ncbi:MAG: hypothetical protein EOO41_02000 [Methanobacteriota archaeon]|nr:MAG: hypothetical protein EOO41_02000 [Euryarchaeota archaeon]
MAGHASWDVPVVSMADMLALTMAPRSHVTSDAAGGGEGGGAASGIAAGAGVAAGSGKSVLKKSLTMSKLLGISRSTDALQRAGDVGPSQREPLTVDACISTVAGTLSIRKPMPKLAGESAQDFMKPQSVNSRMHDNLASIVRSAVADGEEAMRIMEKATEEAASAGTSIAASSSASRRSRARLVWSVHIAQVATRQLGSRTS